MKKWRRPISLSPSTKTILVTLFLILFLVAIKSTMQTGAIELDEMVKIPGGTFTMGVDGGMENSRPPHEVKVDPFFVDAHEVTNVRFAEFLNDIKTTTLDGNNLIVLDRSHIVIDDANSKSVYRPKEGYEEYPVVSVTWYGANEYAKYRGKRLPTEAQWEYAAAGGLMGAKFPWEGDYNPNKSNLAGAFGALTPVMSYLPNGFGVYDMGGNVMEWTRDWYRDGYYEKSPRENPQGPKVGTERVVRGGAFDSLYPVTIRNRYYLKPGSALPNLGFRCVRDGL
jgi:formylglycine-generating enzyme required for sulfatase activity